MKIEKIELFLCRLPLVHFFETSFGRSYDRTFVLVRVEGDGQHEGWGESVAEANPYYSSETTETVWHIITGFIAPLRHRADASSIRATCSRRCARVRGHNMAKAGVEMAAWDLYARIDRPAAVDGARRHARPHRRRACRSASRTRSISCSRRSSRSWPPATSASRSRSSPAGTSTPSSACARRSATIPLHGRRQRRLHARRRARIWRGSIPST